MELKPLTDLVNMDGNAAIDWIIENQYDYMLIKESNLVENRVMPKIADLAEDVQHYISIHWNGKQITPEIGLLHWLKIQEISNKLDKLKE